MEVTLYRVNGIALREKQTDLIPAQSRPNVVRTKKRSIDAPPLMLPTYNAGQQAGPSMSKSTEVDADIETRLAKQKHLVWMLACMLQVKDQSMSSSTGFNIMTREKITVYDVMTLAVLLINSPIFNFGMTIKHFHSF